MPEAGTGRCAPLPMCAACRSLRRRLAGLVGCADPVADRIAHTVEETSAAMDMAPTFGVPALRVAAHIQELRPSHIIQGSWISRACDVRLAAIVEFVLRACAAP